MRKLALVATALLLSSCTSEPEPLEWKPSGSGPITGNGGDGGDGGDGGSGGVGEGGAGGGGGTVPTSCETDADCGRDRGLRCDQNAGICVQGEECDADSSCGFGEDGGYCGDDHDNACVCVEDSSSQYGGVCWYRFAVCEPCETDKDCGYGDMWDDPRGCRDYTIDGEPAKVCLPLKGRSGCIGGTVTGTGELEGYCVPAEGTCSNPDNCDGEPTFDCELNCCNLEPEPIAPICLGGEWMCPGDTVPWRECGAKLAECPCEERAPGDLCGDTGVPACAPDAEDYAACPAMLCSARCDGFDSAQVPAGCSCTCESGLGVVCNATES